MEIRVPHEIVYQTPASVSIPDAVEALLGAERVLLDIGPTLESLFPGLEVNTKLYLKELSEGSLKEVIWAALFIAFQKDLEKEVPPFVDSLLGTEFAGKYDTLITVMFCLLLFYGADYIYRQVSKTPGNAVIKEKLDGVITDVSREFNLSETKVRDVLKERYDNPPRVKLLAKAVIRVFTPSKKQNNAEMTIGDWRIEPRLIAEVPSDAQILEAEDPDSTMPVENVRIELHAQDLDRAKVGWAAVIPELSENRLRMKIFPPIKPEDIYTKQEVYGDVVLVSRPVETGKMEPYMFHLVRLRE